MELVIRSRSLYCLLTIIRQVACYAVIEEFTQLKDKRWGDGSITEVTARSKLQCASLCRLEDLCFAANYKQTICELVKETYGSNLLDIIDAPGWNLLCM